MIQTRRTKQLNRKHLKLEHCKRSAFLCGRDTISFLSSSSNNTYYVKLNKKETREVALVDWQDLLQYVIFKDIKRT